MDFQQIKGKIEVESQGKNTGSKIIMYFPIGDDL